MNILKTNNYIFAETGDSTDETNTRVRTTTTEPPKIERFFTSFDKVFDYLLPIGVILSVVFVIIGGYMWMSSSGNPEKVKQAQGTLTWAIIGLIFVLIAALLVRVLVDYIIGM
jgi:magnesium-transporting ATPase (P-type)